MPRVSMYPKSLRPRLIESIPRIRTRRKVWVEAYGCSASIADSEMINGLLQSGGYELAKSEEDSALNVIVTCSVKDKTEHRMTHRIGELKSTGKPLVIAGCLPKADTALVEELAPAASLMGPHSIDKAAEVVSASFAGMKSVALQDSIRDKVNLPRVRLNPSVGIVEIASGCLSKCSFCQTKLAKGELRSYRPADIRSQITNDVSEGCREIWLTSTDNGCYGTDIGCDLADLLAECSEVQGDFRIRVGMMNPMYVPPMADKLVRAFSHERIFKFLHIPVQSGSNSVLKEMRRGHKSETFSAVVSAFRRLIPELTIATDVIVGFPTETEHDFEMTLELLKDSQPDIVNISRYSSRPGTFASTMPQLDSQVVKSRTERAHAVAREISLARNSLWLGWQGEIIIDEIHDSGVQGRNYAYKPVLVDMPSEPISLGDKLQVKITGISTYALKSEII